MQYFDHSTTAASDDKVLTLRMDCGGAAVDAYWAILEQIYNDESGCSAGAKRALSHRLCTSVEQLEKWISAMLEIGLLERDEENPENITSKRAMENITRYQEKCETARQNALNRTRKSGRKAGAKRALKSTSTTEKTPADNKTKQNKGIEQHKVAQIPIASDGAESACTAPPPQRQCPVCDCPMDAVVSESGAVTYSCNLCGHGEVAYG